MAIRKTKHGLRAIFISVAIFAAIFVAIFVVGKVVEKAQGVWAKRAQRRRDTTQRAAVADTAGTAGPLPDIAPTKKQD